MKYGWFILFTLFLVLIFPVASAYAYLDPASGSVIVQLLVAGVAGLAVVVRVYWNRFLGLFGKKRPTTPPADKESDIKREDEP